MPHTQHHGQPRLHLPQWYHHLCRGCKRLPNHRKSSTCGEQKIMLLCLAWIQLRHLCVPVCSWSSCWRRPCHQCILYRWTRRPSPQHPWPALGISKHGAFEIDNSISRQDTYCGNQADFQLSRWNNMVDIASRHNEFGNDM